jgi:hypothetical protein
MAEANSMAAGQFMSDGFYQIEARAQSVIKNADALPFLRRNLTRHFFCKIRKGEPYRSVKARGKGRSLKRTMKIEKL